VVSPEISHHKPGKRGKIEKFSQSSRRNLAWKYSQGPWLGMLTLTYPTDPTKEDAKRHLHAWLQVLARRGLRYLWVLEFQRRGTPHFHVWIDADVADKIRCDRLRRSFNWRTLMVAWLRIIGEAKNDKARKVALHPFSWCPWEIRVGNNYAAKYADKICQKQLPERYDGFGRWWATTRNVVQTRSVKIEERAETVQFRRNVIRYMERRFPSTKRAFRTPDRGFRLALDPAGMLDVERLAILSFGLDLWDQTQWKIHVPDRNSYSLRCALSQGRHLGGGRPGVEG